MTLASGDEPNDFSPPTSSGNAATRLRKRFFEVFLWLSSNGEVDPPEIRERLLQTITDKKSALIVSAVAVGFTAISAVFLTGALWPCFWLVAELLLDGLRLHLINRHERSTRKRTDESFAMLFCGGFVWTIALGTGIAACVASGNMALSVMAAMVMAGVIGVLTSRNAAVPRYAGLVMWAIGLLFLIGCACAPDRKMLLVACLVPIAVAGMQVILARNYNVIIRMIRAELASRKLALTDRLTALPNRRCFEERLEKMTGDLAEGEMAAGFVLFYLDLDGFKAVNDSYGHGIGDALLKTVARRLVYSVRNRDNIFRLGGDEFAIVLPGVRAAEAAFVAKRVLLSISRPYDLGVGDLVRIGTSIGSVRAPENGRTAEALITGADSALYAAKNAGRGIYLSSSGSAIA